MKGGKIKKGEWTDVIGTTQAHAFCMEFHNKDDETNEEDAAETAKLSIFLAFYFIL